ncbi:hypothetical protein [Vibrio diabolicus]|uniref:hypothetical protein n=1 Tax=Vibrio diabolicus TaxID=50719 RepID=UPI00211A0F7D|nr:hypothetical protein [Vibrio diabolicus]MCQ9065322.1 hypothetical protein [Vibrio diabolicus]
MSKKRDTILWINHAISYFKNQGKAQKDMAAILGLEESRVSEMKTGKSLLSESQKQAIIEICGSPRRDPGRFEVALCYNKFDDFFSSFCDLMENRYLRNLIAFFQNKENQTNLLSHCIPVEDMESNYNEAITLSDIDALVRHDESNEIFQRYQMWLQNIDGAEHPNMSLLIDRISVDDKNSFHLLYQLWFTIQRCPTFVLSNTKQFNLNPIIHTEEIILTGKKILIIENNGKLNPINQPIIERFGSHEKLPSNELIKHDFWHSVHCELYLSEDMNYHLTIQLSNDYCIESFPYEDDISNTNHLDFEVSVGENDLLVVIENINSMELFSTIEDVRKWCALPIDNHFKLKKNIARSGGYVPGVRVLV